MTTKTKLENQIKAGGTSQQQGEDIKNAFTAQISWTNGQPITLNNVKSSVLSQFKINPSLVDKINSKAFADGGLVKCVKPDNKSTITFTDGRPNKEIKISIKSTFGETQLAIHSLYTFKDYLSRLFKIIMPIKVVNALYWFTHDIARIPNEIKPIHSKAYFSINNRRLRYALDDVELFQSGSIAALEIFFKDNAKEIMTFLMSSGGFKKKIGYADLILFTDKKFDRVESYDISKLIDLAINYCTANPNEWFKPGLKKATSGITTVSFYGGLIKLQMKGSKRGTSAYHNLQFRISGDRVKKLATMWGY